MNLNRSLLDRLDRLEGSTAVLNCRLNDIDSKLDRLLERLPDSAQSGEQDGPVEPLAFRLNGKLNTTFRPVDWRLLKCLWENPTRSLKIEDAIELVYGVNADNKDKAIYSAINRLNEKFRVESIRASVHRKAGYLSLDLWNSEPTKRSSQMNSF